MKRREYHEIYGFLPEEIINKISEVDRCRLFTEWVFRKPTSTGWFITRAVVAALGDEFINYMLRGIVEVLDRDGETITKEALVGELTNMMETFASDSNILEEYVRTYREEELGLSDDDFSDDDPTEKVKEVLGEDTPKKTCNVPERDAKGRFVKSK